MVLNPSNSSNLEQLALKGLTQHHGTESDMAFCADVPLSDHMQHYLAP